MSWPVMVPARVGGVAGCVFLWVEHHHVGVAHCWVLGKQAGLVAVWLLWVVPGGLQVMGWWFFWCCCCWSGSCVGSCLVVVGVLFENCTVDASIFVFCVLFCCCEVFMGAWWMPWHQEPMKDVVACDKPRGVGERALIRGCPNGETRQSSWTVTVI